MPLTMRKTKGASGYRVVAYRAASGKTYNAHITGSAALSVPTGVVVAPQGTTGAASYGYRVTAIGGGGETTGATEGTTATGNATLSGANFNRVTWTGVSGASGYNIYRTTGGATQGKIGSVATGVLTFDDTGLVAAGAVPGSNTAVSFNIFVPSLKAAGAGSAVKTGIAVNSARNQTNVIVGGR